MEYISIPLKKSRRVAVSNQIPLRNAFYVANALPSALAGPGLEMNYLDIEFFPHSATPSSHLILGQYIFFSFDYVRIHSALALTFSFTDSQFSRSQSYKTTLA